MADAALDAARDGAPGPPDGASPDGGMDGGTDPGGFYDLAWGAPVELAGAGAFGTCETDPTVTADLAWLVFSRATGTPGDCYSYRRFHVMAWNDGNPVGIPTLVPMFDALAQPETNGHPFDGAVIGMPGRMLLFHAAVVSDARDLRAHWLEADFFGLPTMPTGSLIELSSLNTPDGSESDPTLDREGTMLLFTGDGVLYESRGTVPSTWAAPVAHGELPPNLLDPALSPDGRVLVFAQNDGTSDELYVARRAVPDGPFGAAVKLATGVGQIDDPAASELDPFITSSGDLVFSSDRVGGGTRRVFLARRVAP
jgi:hypothetical protein